jgi:hypothetical protein
MMSYVSRYEQSRSCNDTIVTTGVHVLFITDLLSLTPFVGDALHVGPESDQMGESLMKQAQPIRRLGFPLLLISTLIAGVALTAGPVGAAEEKASPDTVAAGLEKIQGIAAGSAKAVGTDNAKAEELQFGIEPVWQGIEDTVRANDSGAYVALEDSFTLLKIAAKAADPSKASKASEDLSAAAKSYLAAHPGDAAAGSSRTAAAAPSTASAAPAEGSTADAGVGSGTLARTGPGSGTLSGLAGMALGLGGLAVIGGARRRTGRG